jgi:serine/threonine protein kinase
MPEQTVLMIVSCIASGLAHMHTVGGYCHRDVKPANILLDASPSPTAARLVDYGSAAPGRVRCDTTMQASQLQEAAAKFSSMAYRAPELWDPPSPGTVTTKSDIWSLGCTAYAMMYGLSPFESTIVGGVAAGAASASSSSAAGDPGASFAAPQACTHSRVLGAVRFPREDDDPYTSALRRLVMACLQLDAEARPDAAEVAEQSRSLLDPGAAAVTASSRLSGGEAAGLLGADAPLRGRGGAEDRAAAISGDFDEDDSAFNPFSA